MNKKSSNYGLDVRIEGGTPSEQQLVGAILGSSLVKLGHTNIRHFIKPNEVIDPAIQAPLVPSMLDVIRQHSPDFLNMPVIVSAYEPKPVQRERRAVDRVLDRALQVAMSYDDSDMVESSLNNRWNTLSIEEKEELLLNI